MRLTSVQMLSPDSSQPITFNLRDVNASDRYSVRQILGLDADDIVSKFYGKGLQSGKKMYDMRLKPRDIVLRIVLQPNFRLDESPATLRDDLYRTISAVRSSGVNLQFKSGATVVANIAGFITKFEVPYFTKLPEVQITVHCDDPLFRSITPVVMKPADMSAANPTLIPDSLSTAPHGFSFQVTMTGTLASFTIQDVVSSPDWKWTVTPAGGFLSGDKLYFSSEFSNKYCYMVRGVTTTHLLDKIAQTSVWPTIFPGQNSFHFVNRALFNWNTLSFLAAYWGV